MVGADGNGATAGETLGAGVCRSGRGSNVLQEATARLNHAKLQTKRAFMTDSYLTIVWAQQASVYLRLPPTKRPLPSSGAVAPCSLVRRRRFFHRTRGHLEGGKVADVYPTRWGTSRFAYVARQARVDFDARCTAGFRVPRRVSRGALDDGFGHSGVLRVTYHDVTAGDPSGHVEPQVMRFRNLEAQNIVLFGAFADEDLVSFDHHGSIRPAFARHPTNIVGIERLR